MNTKEFIQDVLMHMWFPVQFMAISVSFFPGAILSLLASNPAALMSTSRIKDAWFANFWGKVGPEVRKTASVNAGPLIQQARGVVLDIGPGSGEWLHVFDKSRVTKIYGVEPNRDHYAVLRRRIEEAGLTGVYEIVEGGVEDLTKWGIQEESVDSIVTILCLCSVDSPEEMIEVLYGKLKKGGVWLLHEHVRTKQGGWVKWYQGE
ncbi:methyltransferase domain-containing protein [Rutstroemia sp. NJR-2017a WRK4]|nr:methyltransferase domain-containing protein [Rutstroemia sp. NJR-2017a WRK4]